MNDSTELRVKAQMLGIMQERDIQPCANSIIRPLKKMERSIFPKPLKSLRPLKSQNNFGLIWSDTVIFALRKISLIKYLI